MTGKEKAVGLTSLALDLAMKNPATVNIAGFHG